MHKGKTSERTVGLCDVHVAMRLTAVPFFAQLLLALYVAQGADADILTNPTPSPTLQSTEDCDDVHVQELGFSCVGNKNVRFGWFIYANGTTFRVNGTSNNLEPDPPFPSGEDIHVSCSDGFGFDDDDDENDGYGEKDGPDEDEDDPIVGYEIIKCKLRNEEIESCCAGGVR